MYYLFFQLCLHFSTLDNSITWSRSALNARCRICRRKADAENMLLCDECDKGYHVYCLKPKLKVCIEQHRIVLCNGIEWILDSFIFLFSLDAITNALFILDRPYPQATGIAITVSQRRSQRVPGRRDRYTRTSQTMRWMRRRQVMKRKGTFQSLFFSS